jgi:ribosome recycling factor
MLDDLRQDAEERMVKSVTALSHAFNKIRTGRAHPSLLDGLVVSYYGVDTPLSQVGNVNVLDARTLSISVWEKNLIPEVEKAIHKSDLGLNPAVAGTNIRIPMPPLTEERRMDFIKLVKSEAEQTKVAIRNIRRDANSKIKEMLKKKEISEDDEKQANEHIQKITDSHINSVDLVLKDKEADLMQV